MVSWNVVVAVAAPIDAGAEKAAIAPPNIVLRVICMDSVRASSLVDVGLIQ